MATIERSIDIEAPVRVVYNQWTQFEEFPRFMEGVQEVRQLDDKHLHWRAVVGGAEKVWDAEITEQIPDERVAWRARAGAGVSTPTTVSRPASPSRTSIRLKPGLLAGARLESVAVFGQATYHFTDQFRALGSLRYTSTDKRARFFGRLRSGPFALRPVNTVATGEFGARFIELARSIYRWNDQRACLKRHLNELLRSRIIEEKSYGQHRTR